MIGHMSKLSIVFEPYAGTVARDAVDEIINRRNIAITGHDEWYPVAFFLKDDAGEIFGGLLGNIWAKRMYIATLAVREPQRGHGYGTQLMERAEHYALGKGCVGSWLSTFSFQARPFYERLGYRVFGTLENYPQGHNLFFMTKDLA